MRCVVSVAAMALCAFWFGGTAAAAEWYVAPTGTSDGDGSMAKPWDLATALGHPPLVKPGDTVWLRGGTYVGANRDTFTCKLHGEDGKPITLRQYPGERATVTPTLTLEGCSHVWMWGFEVMNPDTTEYAPTEHGRWPAVWLRQSDHCKLINLIVHDGGQGIGAWVESADLEICGCLMFNNGWPGSNQGHAIYTQNRDGKKYITDNMMFNSLGTGYGIHAYGSEKAFVNNFVFEGNVAFNNHGNNILIGGGTPSENIEARHNFTWGVGGVRIGYAAVNKNAVVEDNYFADRILFRNYEHLTVRDNTFFIRTQPVSLDIGKLPLLPKYVWDGNHYFIAGELVKPFRLISATDKPQGVTSEDLTFAEWRARIGGDAKSDLTVGVPSANRVFIRMNRYEPGRANVIVYNWAGLDTTTADLTGVLKPGDQFELRDAQNFFGAPVVAGAYKGGVIEIPMKLTEVMQPVTGPPFAHTPPEFGAFILIRTAAVGK